MNRPRRLNRRQILAGVGAVGMLCGIGLTGSAVTGSKPDYTDYTLAATNDPLVRVAWYSVYNGDLISGSPTDGDEWQYNETSEYVNNVSSVIDETDPSNPIGSGPAIEVQNLLPGDHGTMSIGLLADDDAEIWLRLHLTASSGALADRIDAHVWYDEGIFGIGGCTGSEDRWGTDAIADGSLTEIGGKLNEGVLLDPGLTQNGCLEEGDRRCLGFSWSLPKNVGNEVQGDSVSFSIDFVAVNCDEDIGNPFDGGG